MDMWRELARGAAAPWASVGLFPGGHGAERERPDTVMQKGRWSWTLRDEQWSVEMEPHALGWEAQRALGRREDCVSRVSSSYEGQRRASQA